MPSQQQNYFCCTCCEYWKYATCKHALGSTIMKGKVVVPPNYVVDSLVQFKKKGLPWNLINFMQKLPKPWMFVASFQIQFLLIWLFSNDISLLEKHEMCSAFFNNVCVYVCALSNMSGNTRKVCSLKLHSQPGYILYTYMYCTGL